MKPQVILLQKFEKSPLSIVESTEDPRTLNEYFSGNSLPDAKHIQELMEHCLGFRLLEVPYEKNRLGQVIFFCNIMY